jgi:hypothetical protein
MVVFGARAVALAGGTTPRPAVGYPPRSDDPRGYWPGRPRKRVASPCGAARPPRRRPDRLQRTVGRRSSRGSGRQCDEPAARWSCTWGWQRRRRTWTWTCSRTNPAGERDINRRGLTGPIACLRERISYRVPKSAAGPTAGSLRLSTPRNAGPLVATCTE